MIRTNDRQLNKEKLTNTIKGGQKQVSVIVPVYNSALFLTRCVKSILSQTFTAFELILVDDGSTDKSGDICDELASSDERIKVFHRKNAGAGAARKFGVSQAKNEWIMFCDSDDILPQNSIELLYEHHNKADIVVGTLEIITPENNKRIFNHKIKGVLSSEIYIEALLLNNTSIGPVSKLFKRSLFSLESWNDDKDIKNNEDLLMLIVLSLKADRIYIDNNIICYNYLLRDNSGRTNVSPIKVWFKLFSIIENLIFERFNKTPLAFYLYELHRLYDCSILNGNMVNTKNERVLKILEICNKAELNKEDYIQYKVLKSPLLQRCSYIKFTTLQYFKKAIKKIILLK